MLNQKRICVVLPAYNAAATLEETWKDIPEDIVDDILLVDDASTDETLTVAKRLGIETHFHEANRGYGANQKTCYRLALEKQADIVVLLHPDYQYTPKLITAMCSMLAYGVYDVVLGSRILGQGALQGGMPFYKYVANRILTFAQNILVDRKHTEYHTGYRAYTRTVLEKIPYHKNSEDFVFDNQLLVQVIANGFNIGEVSCPTRYAESSSSINFPRSLKYGVGCMWTSFRYFLHRIKLIKYPMVMPDA